MHFISYTTEQSYQDIQYIPPCFVYNKSILRIEIVIQISVSSSVTWSRTTDEGEVGRVLTVFNN